MTAPIPLQGTGNPYSPTYQKDQFGSDTPAASTTPAFTVFQHLVSPPAAGVTASASPSELFKENTNPPDQHSSSFMTSTPPTNIYSRGAGQ